jgi:hypothetical protein
MNRKLRKKRLLKEERKCIKLELRNSEIMNLKRRKPTKDRLIFSNKNCFNKNRKMNKSRHKYFKEKI